MLPSREALTQPLLAVLHTQGPLAPSEAAAAVADHLGLPAEDRDLKIDLRDRGIIRTENALQYQLRWVRQELTRDDLLDGSLRGLWRLSRKGEEFYVRAAPGVVLSVFETNLGTALCGEAQTVLQLVNPGTFQTVITSPVYPKIAHKPYGGMTPADTVAFVDGLFRLLQPKLTADANVFLNLGYVPVADGVESTYIERLLIALEDQGYRLIERMFWINPSKPLNGHYVTHERNRLVQKVEPIFRLALTSKPRGDSRKILVPYSSSMRRCLAKGGDQYGPRPSGHGHRGRSFARDNGGAIPGNAFVVPHEASNHPSHRLVESRGLTRHPAVMPEALIEPLIEYTTEPDDIVADVMSGSGSVARVAERKKRRWFSTDVHLNYVANSSVTFESAPGFRRTIDPVPLQESLAGIA